ncbi:MAG TPA: hypothetical protein VED40_14655 [Azospirillaceae bacterium]|nr:hypothetical protein [Azospirillaceae bacterium]
MPTLTDLIAEELARPMMPEAVAVAEAIRARHGPSVAAVLFYGSVLRTRDLDGILDFYVLVDSLPAYHDHALAAAANQALPPNVAYWEVPVAQGAAVRTMRAKVAIMTRAQFRRAVSPASLDTTIWARFAQPAGLVCYRDESVRAWAAESVAAAVATAATWAVRLGPERGAALEFWTALFRQTYAAELRAERAERPSHIVDTDPARYDALFRPALAAAGIAFNEADGTIIPAVTAEDRARAIKGWAVRRRLGKALNVARLMKAAFTFQGGVDYLAWKVERHSGVKVELTPWQRRHPILASPLILWRLRKQGAVR